MMQTAIRNLLVGIGDDPSREGLLDTPKVGHMYIDYILVLAVDPINWFVRSL
jgi:GTP cyclohydrolase I